MQVGQVYLACGSTDMRKSIDGLAVLVREGFNLDPFAPALFSQQKRFGAASERTHPEQLRLFNEVESEADPARGEPTMETITYRRRKQRGQREVMREDLPVETVEYHLPEQDRTWPSCSGPLHAMSTEVRQELKIIPAEVKVVKHVRHVATSGARTKARS